MSWKTFLSLTVLSTTGVFAASSGFLLGLDYSRNTDQKLVGTDSTGALYLTETGGDCDDGSITCVVKLASDGTTVIREIRVDGGVIAISASGEIFATVLDTSTANRFFVEKLSADGLTIAWKVPVQVAPGPDPNYPGPGSAVAVDPSGRVYIAYSRFSETVVVAVNADGSGLDYTVQLHGSPMLITADGTGSATLVLDVSQPDKNDRYSLTRLSPNGTSQIYSIPIEPATAMAEDAAGNVAVLEVVPDNAGFSRILQRFNPQGEPVFSLALPVVASFNFDTVETFYVEPKIAMDAAGNIYVAGSFLGHSVKNSVVSCSSDGWGTGTGTSLLVYAPDGSLLDGTYLPGFNPLPFVPPLALAVGPAVYVLAGDGTLSRLSQNSAAHTVPLACIANAASFVIADVGLGDPGVAPGEVVALFGNGLGPQQGIQTQATLQSPFPKTIAGVTVTFDGAPVPLLWVQDGQINAVVPWALTPGQNTVVCVTNNSTQTNCLTEQVAQSSPGVLTVDGFHAAAINQDGTVNSAEHPAPLNSELTFYAIGLGPINPAQADGSLVGLPLPANVLPLDISTTGPPMINTLSGLTIDYAGPAPGELAGVTQINAHLYGMVAPTVPLAVFVPTGGSSFGMSTPFLIYVTDPYK